jgi:hypothetical protein
MIIFLVGLLFFKITSLIIPDLFFMADGDSDEWDEETDRLSKWWI